MCRLTVSATAAMDPLHWFELMELTFSHMLPNFNECWWDSWILDVAMCNFLGLWLGMKTVRWFGSLEYNWSGISKQPTIYAKVRELAHCASMATVMPMDMQCCTALPASC